MSVRAHAHIYTHACYRELYLAFFMHWAWLFSMCFYFIFLNEGHPTNLIARPVQWVMAQTLKIIEPNAFNVQIRKLKETQGRLMILLRSHSKLVAEPGQRNFHFLSSVVIWGSGSPGDRREPLDGGIPGSRTLIFLWCLICFIKCSLHPPHQATL